jgi:sterol desaturase/sphingolipid hydroxylase (fatty acid hydroxylase superfamily)
MDSSKRSGDSIASTAFFVFQSHPIPAHPTSLLDLTYPLQRPQMDLSRDPNVFIFSGTLLKRITRGLIAWVVVLVLLVPVIAINAVERVAIRMGIIVVASAVVIMMLALMTKIKTWEMFLGGAT